MTNRNFDEWLSKFRPSISSYDYYIDFEKVIKNVDEIKVELNILNSLIGSKNIEDEFEKVVTRYPETLKCIPLLLAVRSNEIYAQDEDGAFLYNFKTMNYDIEQYKVFMRKTGLFDMIANHLVNNLVDYALGIETGLDSNGRKNRGGHQMEDLVEKYIVAAGFKKNENYFKEMYLKDIESKWNIDLSALSNQGKAAKRFDFVIKTDKMIYAIETNFYGDELGKVDVYVKKYDANHSDMATQKCVYVRYPYMKIKMSDNLSKLPFSAMCIIGDNEINSLLRDVENPQHTDWEFNRLNDDKPLKKKTRNAERLLREEIRKFVTEVMLADSSEKTDVLGAGEFLPSTEDGDMEVEVKTIKKDIVRTTKARKNKAANPKKEKANEDDDAFKHQNGSLTDDGDDGKKQNTGGGGEDDPYDDPNDQGGRGTATGNEPILKKVKLGGIKYKNIVVDEKAGRYDFRFTAPHNEADFELELKMCGDGSDTYTLDIISAEVDGKPCRIEDGKVRMKLSKDVTYVVKYTTNRKSMWSYVWRTFSCIL